MRKGSVLFHGEVPGSLRVEIPTTHAEMRQGLAGRHSLAPDAGMLFDMMTDDYHAFHMVGVAFPLDFIFVTSDRRVLIILHRQPPGLIEVGATARWVIEASGGWASRHNVRAGAHVTFAV